MWDRAYLRRLQKDLPSWVERGWVTPDGEPAILQQLQTSAAGARKAPMAFAILGVLSVGTGVILFFAANWSGMPKLAKLAVLFSGMWGVYLAAGWALARPDNAVGRFAQALLLLGTILFGANINLIAQAYHISGHYPNAILLWSLGALAVAWLARSQPAAVLGLIILTLWSGMETVGFAERFHWPFLVVWALFLPPICLWTWRFAAGTAMLALLIWNFMISERYFDWFMFNAPYLLSELSFLLAVALFLVGILMEWQERLSPIASIVQRYSIVGALLNLHLLTHLRSVPRFRGAAIGLVSNAWAAGMLAALAAVLALGIVVLHFGRGRLLPNIVRSSQVVLGVVFVLVVASLYAETAGDWRTAIGISYNIFYYVALFWLIYVGYQRGDAFRVNIGFVFFALGLIYLYFDRFWTMMNRSFFFVAGGLLLCAGGYVLEVQRRRLVTRLGRTDAQGDPA